MEVSHIKMLSLDSNLQTLNGPNSTTLTVFSLNVWGIKLGPLNHLLGLSPNRISRMKAIAAHLSEKDYDFVCLQELWVKDDFKFIKDRVQLNLPHSHYFYSGLMGSGIGIFSRWPLKEIFYHQWQLNGYFYKFWHGDWFGGKGIAFIQCIVNGFTVNVYSTHLHAEYDASMDEYLSHRIIQAFDLSQFIRITSSSADLAILAGDLNSPPSEICYRLLLTNSNLRSAFDDCVSDTKFGTYNCCKNTYSKENNGPPDQRIDHILYKTNSKHNVQLVSSDQPLSDLVPNEVFSHSDHEAISATFRLSREPPHGDQAGANFFEDDKCHHETLKEALSICKATLEKLQKDPNFYLSFLFFSISILFFIMSILLTFFMILIIPSVFLVASVFCFFKAVLWVPIEKNGILSGYYAMEMALLRLKKEKFTAIQLQQN